MELILIALAAMKVTEFAKELIPFPVPPWSKSAFSLVIVGVLGIVAQQGAVEILGVWGATAVAHEIRACLSMISDDKKQQIILRPAQRRR